MSNDFLIRDNKYPRLIKGSKCVKISFVKPRCQLQSVYWHRCRSHVTVQCPLCLPLALLPVVCIFKFETKVLFCSFIVPIILKTSQETRLQKDPVILMQTIRNLSFSSEFIYKIKHKNSPSGRMIRQLPVLHCHLKK